MVELRHWRALRRQGDAEAIPGFWGPHSCFGPSIQSGTHISRLSQPVGDPDDRSKFIRYGRASAQLIDWRRNGVLGVGKSRAFIQSSSGVAGLLCLARAEDLFSATEIDVSRKEDRLRLLEATRTQFEPIIAISTGAGFDPAKLIPNAEPCGQATVETAYRMDGELPDPESLVVVAGAEELEAARTFRNLRNPGADAIERWVMVLALPAVGPTVRPRAVDLSAISDDVILSVASSFGELAEVSSAEADRPGSESLGLRLADGRGFRLTPKVKEEHLNLVEGPDMAMISRNSGWFGQRVVAPAILGSAPVRSASDAARAIMTFGPVLPSQLLELSQSGASFLSLSLDVAPRLSSGIALFSYGDAIA